MILELRRRLATGVAGALGLAFVLPAAVAAHSLNTTYTSRLPLAVYLAGAATTVTLSFIFVIVRDVRAALPTAGGAGAMPSATIRFVLRFVGLVGWAWIVAQGLAGGSSDGSVATLFLWVYGWVGVAIVSAVIGPVWHFLDPFSTLHDLGASLLRRLGVAGWAPAAYPTGLGRWPATIGFAAFVWLELVILAGPSTLFVVLLGYTAFSLAMMAQFGRDTWRSQGETFTVWFRLLGRLAMFALVDESGRVRRRSLGSGVLEPGWMRSDVTLVALSVGSILFDGLSQTQIFFDLFGAPGVVVKTIVLGAFLAILVGATFGVTRTVGLAATGAGLLPIALGYLIAHYLTYLLIDGQRIVIAISDPLQKGWNLFGTAFYAPTGAWLPPGLVWTLQGVGILGGSLMSGSTMWAVIGPIIATWKSPINRSSSVTMAASRSG